MDKLTSATGVVSVAAATAPTTGQVLTATSGTVATWQTPAVTAPAGSNTQVQFNNSGAFGASANFTWDGSTLALTGAVSATTTGKVGTTLGVGAATPSASGAGITFPATQSASTDANTLDDYEEGTWTPSLKFGGASVGMAGTFEGYYTKIGRLVTGQGRMILSAKGSSTGAATLALPFTSAATNTLPGMSVGYYESWASSITASCYINSGSALLQLTNLTGTTVGALTDTNFTNATRCDFSFSYIV